MKKKSVNLYPLLDAEKFIAELYSMYGDTIRASQYYAQVMVVVDSLRPIIPEALPIASHLASYGHHLLMYKYYEEAERVLIEVLSIFEHELGYGNPKIISVLKDLHTLYTSTGRHEEAQKINSKIDVIEVTPIE